MPEQIIRHALTGKTLFSGRFASLRACAEAAVAANVPLSGADLRHANLANAALDNAVMKGARFDGANLTGANLSEALLDGSVFAHASLQNACLCFSSARHCDFSAAQFGATDIAGARIDHARFSSLSAFTLNFRDAETMQGCVYLNAENSAACPFSRPPVAIFGLLQTVVILNSHIQIGQTALSLEDWNTGGNDNRAPVKSGRGVHPFLSSLRRPLDGLVRYRGLISGGIK